MNWYLEGVPPRECVRHQQSEMSYEDGIVRLGMCFALRDLLGAVGGALSWRSRCDAALDVVLMSYVAGVASFGLERLINDWAILILDKEENSGGTLEGALFDRHRLAVYMSIFSINIRVDFEDNFFRKLEGVDSAYVDVALETELLGRMWSGETVSSIRQRDWAGITEFGRLLLAGEQSALSALLVTEMRSCRRRGVSLAKGHSNSVVGRTRGFRDHGHCLDAICMYKAAERWGLRLPELPADLRSLSVETGVSQLSL